MDWMLHKNIHLYFELTWTQMTDIKFSFDYVLSIFLIIQSRTKAERSYNDHEGTKLVKQTAEIDALRVLYPLVKFKPDTTKKWFCKMYDLIDLFYGKLRDYQDEEESEKENCYNWKSEIIEEGKEAVND